MIKKIKNIIKPVIKFNTFSRKQLQILTWWEKESPYSKYNGIICDGSIRAGKTVPMAISFVLWAMKYFDAQNFAMCGKTVGSFKRNVWKWLKPVLILRGFAIEEDRTSNLIYIQKGYVVNYFYIFGGRDESSQDLIQGITLAGLLLDEVALMPESFVNQATGRCSILGAKLWFNCNPESPVHYFYTDWIQKAKEKKFLHIHFMMEDNPSLSQEVIQSYKSRYAGVFFQRFILGLWVMAQGAIYKDCFDDDNLFGDELIDYISRNIFRMKRYIFIDYGTVNPMVFLDVYDDNEKLYVVNEYYYDSKKTGIEKTDLEYGEDLLKFSSKQMREVRREIQIIFQDPFSSLDPRMSVGQIIEEPLIIHKVKDPEERKKRVLKVMDLVGLPSAYYNRYPHEFSGGQRQRISIARAIVLDAKIIFCDEPVSALDVSIQSKILNLLRDLQAELGLTFVFISHALNVVRHISDRVCVMYLGKIMEIAPAEHIFEQAAHPYTQALLSAIPIPDPDKHRQRILLTGDIPSPRNPPSGCRFHTRCPNATQRCACEEPPLVEYAPGHMVACHFCSHEACEEATK